MEISELQEKHKALRAHVCRKIEFPEPGLRLQLNERKGSEIRQFKHLQQMCMLHYVNMERASQIKLVSLIDGYSENVTTKSAIGIYLFARTILEFAAFTSDLSFRLKAIRKKPENDWRPKGEQYFGTMVRARFGTSNPDLQEHLKKSGISKRNLSPFNIMESIKKLESSKGGSNLAGKYDYLCDFVHHNLSSHAASSPGYRVGGAAHSEGGGQIITGKDSAIIRYEYPTPSRAVQAASDTIEMIDACIVLIVEAINSMPDSPYTQAQVKLMTGTRFGLTEMPKGMYVPPIK